MSDRINVEPPHVWGDDWFHARGDDLILAMEFIKNYMTRNGYILIFKEKWGTVRYEHVYEADAHGYIDFSEPADTPDAIRTLAKGVKKATSQWPHIKTELVVDFDWPEYLDVDLRATIDQYWDSD